MQNWLILISLLICSNVIALPQVILDTDIGGDIDDTWALMLMIGSGKVDLKLVVTAHEDTETKAKLVARMLQTVDRTDIPIGIGMKTSDTKINQLQWIENYSLDDYKGKIYPNGIEVMIDTLRNAKEKMTLCVLGPMTNIAKALEIAPDIAQKARIVCMAGSVYIGYNGKQGRDREYNVCEDVESVRKVFSAPWEITMIPLDTCGTIVLKEEKYKKVETSSSPLAKVVIENYNIWTNRKQFPEHESSVLFDTLAAYCTWTEDVVDIKTLNIVIDNEGKTCPDEKGRPVRCALTWKGKERFENTLVEILTKPNLENNTSSSHTTPKI